MGRKKKDPEHVSRVRRELANRRWGKAGKSAKERSGPDVAARRSRPAKDRLIAAQPVEVSREELARRSRAAFGEVEETVAPTERTLIPMEEM